MKLAVPYYSQHLDVKDPEWKSRSCGVCALKMAMEYAGAGDRLFPSLDELIKEGLEAGAYLKGVGWVHQGLVDLAKKYGFTGSFKKEWQEDEKETALENLIGFLENETPVLASIKSAGGGHLVLLIGFEKDENGIHGFYLHDPDANDKKDGEAKFLSALEFLSLWKGRIVVVK